MKKVFTIIKILMFFIIFGIVFFRTSDVLARKMSIGPPWNFSVKVRGFKNLEKHSVDILVLGSSHAYCSFVPTVIWEENKFLCICNSAAIFKNIIFLFDRSIKNSKSKSCNTRNIKI